MTKARQHLPGQVTMLTRRTDERRYFLRPDVRIRRIIMYELAKGSTARNLDVHALMAMGNHPHIAATDRDGERSDFMRDFCSGVARARNAEFDRKGHFWDTQQFGDTVLLDRDAIERKLLYIWLNPVAAGLVARAEHWPGAKILPRDWGKEMTIRTPNSFYNQKKAKTIKFTPMPPPGYEDMSLAEVIEHFEGLLRDAEDELREKRRRAGSKVRGVRRVLRVNPLDAPGTRARRGKLNPRFASRDPVLLKAALKERRNFIARYDEANEKWRNGDRDVLFPAGTIRLRKIARVRCDATTGCEPSTFAA